MGERLFGKTAVITGAGSGIGRATARRFAAEGANVVVADINVDSAEAVVDEIRADGGSALAVPVDVTDPRSLERGFEAATNEFGRVDVVSCNAGLARFPRPVDLAWEADFDAIFAVNVKGLWNSVRAAVGPLRAAGGGAIIVTGSIMGERTRAGHSIYAASKAAANHLARSFALDLAKDNIRVNAVAPVATDTAMLPQFLGPDEPETTRATFIAGIPLGRLAQPEDVANAALYLASDDARFITGVVLPVDGGRGI